MVTRKILNIPLMHQNISWFFLIQIKQILDNINIIPKIIKYTFLNIYPPLVKQDKCKIHKC